MTENDQVCGNVSVINDCIPSCSAREYHECQDDLEICLLALGKEIGSCECLGRFQKCAVDVGCDRMNEFALSRICDAAGCSYSQCQIGYPKATQCDWDSHVECEDELEACLRESTVRRGQPYIVGNLVRWRGDPYVVEQRKFAERCQCYSRVSESFSSPSLSACGKQFGFEQNAKTQWQDSDYDSIACMSNCSSASALAFRQALIQYDCAICGDGKHQPGREECDDGNLDPLDGCDNTCKIEPPQRFMSTLIKSPPSYLPGSVIIVWNHTMMAKHAALYNLPHRHLDYTITVERRECPGCPSDPLEIRVPYEACATVEKWRGISDCSFEVTNLDSGELLNVTLAAWNLAGMGISHSHTIRWMLLPKGDVRLLWKPDDVQLEWNAPSDTGYGDPTSLPILRYHLEVSSCKDFSQIDDLCSYWSDSIEPSHSSLVQGSANGFEYPIRLSIAYDLHPGFFYYYRIRPWNQLGPAVQIEEVQAQFGAIPYDSPIIQFPVDFPVATAVTGSGSQIWQGSAVSESVDRTMLHVIGFPLVRDLSKDIEITITADGTHKNGWSDDDIAQSLQVVTSSLEEGTTFNFIPPAVQITTLSKCGLCIFTVNVRFRRWSAKAITFSLKYFSYPQAAMLGVNPYNGPVVGGTIINLVIQDFEGPWTRAGAGLESLYAVAFDGQALTVQFEAIDPFSNSSMVEQVFYQIHSLVS